MRNLLFILALTILTSCGVNWQVSTYNYDPIYEDENYIVVSDEVKVDTLNEFQFRNKLRTDFNFRYDFAQYALSQPRSFDWNNRLLGRQYDSRWNSYYWNRTQMWNDWVWGYTGWNSWGSPHRWSPFGYDRWGYGIHYGWNNHGWGYNNWMGNVYYGNGWNNYYGWNGYYNNNWGWRQHMNDYAWQNRNRSNTVRVNGRRGSISDEVVSNRRVRTNNRVNTNTRTNTKPRVYTPINNTKPRVIREKPTVPVIRNNNRPNNTRPVIRNNNSTPTINRSTPVRNNSTPTRRSGGTQRR